MSREMQKRMSIIIGSFLVIVMAATAILPAISNPAPTQTIEATPLPSPEPFPTALANVALDFSARYIHPGALYTIPIPQPLAWNQVLPSNEADLARTTLRGDLSVIEVYVQDAAGLSLDDLPQHFTSTNLERTWRNYQAVSRRGSGELRGDRYYVDYNLTLNRRLFNARHLAWTDGHRLYVVRVVGPSNAIEQTIFLAEQMALRLEEIPMYGEGTAGWTGNYDPVSGYVLRFPSSWEVQDYAPGNPLSIQIDAQKQLRIEAIPNAIHDEEQVLALLAKAFPNASVFSHLEWEGGDLISFAFETALGEEHSAAWYVQGKDDHATLLAEIIFEESDLDLVQLAAESSQDAGEESDPTAPDHSEILAVLRTVQSVDWDYITQDALEADEDGRIIIPLSE